MSLEIQVSLLTGVIQSLLYTPIDKALYLSINNNNKLFNVDNWKTPYSGFRKSIYIKIITYGLYYYCIDNYSKKYNNIYTTSIMTSTTTSLILNPLHIVKFKAWNDNKNTIKIIKNIYNNEGLSGFTNGLFLIIFRDFIFNILYLKFKSTIFIEKIIILSIINIILSPINIIKLKKINNNVNNLIIIKDIYDDIKLNNFKIMYIINKFSIGSNIIRNALSIYTGEIIYKYIYLYLNTILK